MRSAEDPTSVPSQPSPARRISQIVFVGFGGIALFFLLAEHRAHFVPYLPFLLVAACPMLHFFHHRGRNGHGRSP